MTKSHEEIRKAAEMALEFLTNTTTDEFAKGADREIRAMLAKALGKPVEDYVL